MLSFTRTFVGLLSLSIVLTKSATGCAYIFSIALPRWTFTVFSAVPS
jgi:hypothetical protein